MELNTLKKLYTEQLKDLYSAEKQLIKALPKMAEFATNEDLKQGFKKHLKETEGQVERLERIFSDMNISGSGKTCAAMKGLVEEGSELMEEDGVPAVLDAGLIAAAQRVEHYEIAAYGCVKAYAELLGEKKAVGLLQKTLDEESKTNQTLTELAESSINLEASRAGSEEKERDDWSSDTQKSARNSSDERSSSSRNRASPNR